MSHWASDPTTRAKSRVFYSAVHHQPPGASADTFRLGDFVLLSAPGERRPRLGKCVTLWEEEQQTPKHWLRVQRYKYIDEVAARGEPAVQALVKLASTGLQEVVDTREREEYALERILGKATVLCQPELSDLEELSTLSGPVFVCHYMVRRGCDELLPWDAAGRLRQTRKRPAATQKPTATSAPAKPVPSAPRPLPAAAEAPPQLPATTEISHQNPATAATSLQLPAPAPPRMRLSLTDAAALLHPTWKRLAATQEPPARSTAAISRPVAPLPLQPPLSAAAVSLLRLLLSLSPPTPTTATPPPPLPTTTTTTTTPAPAPAAMTPSASTTTTTTVTATPTVQAAKGAGTTSQGELLHMRSSSSNPLSEQSTHAECTPRRPQIHERPLPVAAAAAATSATETSEQRTQRRRKVFGAESATPESSTMSANPLGNVLPAKVPERRTEPAHKKQRVSRARIRIGEQYQATIPNLQLSHHDVESVNQSSASQVWSRELDHHPQLESFLGIVRATYPPNHGDAVFFFDPSKQQWAAGIIVKPLQRPTKPFDRAIVSDGKLLHKVFVCDCISPEQHEAALTTFHAANGLVSVALQLLPTVKRKPLQHSWAATEVVEFTRLCERFSHNLQQIHTSLQGLGFNRTFAEVVDFYHSVYLSSSHHLLLASPRQAQDYDAILPTQEKGARQTRPSAEPGASLNSAANSLLSGQSISPRVAPTMADTPATSAISGSSSSLTTLPPSTPSSPLSSLATTTTTTTTAAQSFAPSATTTTPGASDESDHEIYSIASDDLDDVLTEEDAATPGQTGLDVQNRTGPGYAPRATRRQYRRRRMPLWQTNATTVHGDGDLPEYHPEIYHCEPHEEGPDKTSGLHEGKENVRTRPSLPTFIADVRATLPKSHSDLLVSKIIACGIGQAPYDDVVANVDALLHAQPHLREQFNELESLNAFRNTMNPSSFSPSSV